MQAFQDYWPEPTINSSPMVLSLGQVPQRPRFSPKWARRGAIESTVAVLGASLRSGNPRPHHTLFRRSRTPVQPAPEGLRRACRPQAASCDGCKQARPPAVWRAGGRRCVGQAFQTPGREGDQSALKTLIVNIAGGRAGDGGYRASERER